MGGVKTTVLVNKFLWEAYPLFDVYRVFFIDKYQYTVLQHNTTILEELFFYKNVFWSKFETFSVFFMISASKISKTFWVVMLFACALKDSVKSCMFT